MTKSNTASTPVDETYIITFESRGQTLVSLDLVRGEDNEFPDLAVRYTDLHLPERVRVMLRVTPQGIEALRLDKNSDGDFETTLIGDVPSGGEDDDGVVKVTTSEQG